MAPPAAAATTRLPVVDAARGVALAAMAVYHFSWDLRHFAFIAADVEGAPGWRLFARAIAATFLFLAGVSLVLANRNGFRAAAFVRRLAVIAAAAAAITAATFFIFPDSYIFFGILHCIALSSVLGLAFLRAPPLLTASVAILCLAAPALLAGPAFESPALLWLGLTGTFPRTNDYVPILPWFGVVLVGVVAGRLLDRMPHLRSRLAAPAPRALAWAGRHSLAIYLLHQPLLFGLVLLAAQIAPPDTSAVFMQSCTASCAEAEAEAGLCRRICMCLAHRSRAEGLWEGVMTDTLSDEQRVRYFDLAASCQAQEGR